MDCTPNSLANGARCFCLPNRILKQMQIYLLCQWLEEVGPEGLSFLLEDEGGYILLDDGGRIIIN